MMAYWVRRVRAVSGAVFGYWVVTRFVLQEKESPWQYTSKRWGLSGLGTSWEAIVDALVRENNVQQHFIAGEKQKFTQILNQTIEKMHAKHTLEKEEALARQHARDICQFQHAEEAKIRKQFAHQVDQHEKLQQERLKLQQELVQAQHQALEATNKLNLRIKIDSILGWLNHADAVDRQEEERIRSLLQSFPSFEAFKVCTARQLEESLLQQQPFIPLILTPKGRSIKEALLCLHKQAYSEAAAKMQEFAPTWSEEAKRTAQVHTLLSFYQTANQIP